MMKGRLARDGEAEGVIDRQMVFCEYLQEKEWHELLVHHSCCDRFHLHCCACEVRAEQAGYYFEGCHHFRVFYTDGACRSNGSSGTFAGLGVAYGSLEANQISVPIDERTDPGNPRTKQRAELLAAIHAVRCAAKVYEPSKDDQRACCVITTNSEYVVKGMTEWLSNWKVSYEVWSIHKWRTSRGKRPNNIDLFRKLDELIVEAEEKGDVEFGFFHIPQDYNYIAEDLAKAAALQAEPDDHTIDNLGVYHPTARSDAPLSI